MDERWAAGAPLREPSHADRLRRAEQLRAEQVRAEELRWAGEQDRAWAERYVLQPPPAPRRRRRRRPPTGPPGRLRQALGLVVVVVVVLGVYVEPRLSGHPSLISSTVTGQAGTCPPSAYPPGARYRFEACLGSKPLGWGHCATVTVSFDPAGAPAGWQADAGAALAQLARATGLRFRSEPRGGTITVAWDAGLLSSGLLPSGPGAAPGSAPRAGAAPGAAHEAGVTRYLIRPSLLGGSFSSASIRISSHLPAGDGPTGEVPVMLHELGHAVGLGHVPGPETMNPVDQGFPTYQAGDLEGLEALYRPASCPPAG